MAAFLKLFLLFIIYSDFIANWSGWQHSSILFAMRPCALSDWLINNVACFWNYYFSLLRLPDILFIFISFIWKRRQIKLLLYEDKMVNIRKSFKESNRVFLSTLGTINLLCDYSVKRVDTIRPYLLGPTYRLNIRIAFWRNNLVRNPLLVSYAVTSIHMLIYYLVTIENSVCSTIQKGFSEQVLIQLFYSKPIWLGIENMEKWNYHKVGILWWFLLEYLQHRRINFSFSASARKNGIAIADLNFFFCISF